MRLPLGFALMLALLTGSSSACSSVDRSGGDLPSPVPSSDLPGSSIRVKDLLAPSPESFEVAYNWIDAASPSQPGIFVLRHLGGRERWDWLDNASGLTGAFDIMDAGTRISCLWFTATVTESVSSCATTISAAPGSNALRLALGQLVTKNLRSRNIAGHDTECYAFLNVDNSQGEACVDVVQHILLYLSGRTGIASNRPQLIEATSITRVVADMGDATSDSALLTPEKPARDSTVPRSALHLPPGFKLGSR